MEAEDVRLRQLTRMLGRPVPQPMSLDDALPLADAIFEEAANSDDVLDVESAAAYLAARIAFFGDLLPQPVTDEISKHFTARWRSWEQV